MKKRFILLLVNNMFLFSILFFANTSLINAQTYYADLDIEVRNDGSLDISGITNDPMFTQGIHHDFTSKKGAYWLINISSDKRYSDYIISLTLPQGAEFNYLKTEERSRVSYDKGIRIIASGSGNLNLIIQYQIKDKHEPLFLFWFALTLCGLIILGFFAWRKFLKRKKRISAETLIKNKAFVSKKEIKNEKLEVLKRTLNDNQIIILNMLLSAGGELTQKQLQYRSGLPKATLSRNIDFLSKNNIIIKQSRGLTNMIIFNEELVE